MVTPKHNFFLTIAIIVLNTENANACEYNTHNIRIRNTEYVLLSTKKCIYCTRILISTRMHKIINIVFITKLQFVYNVQLPIKVCNQ